MRGGKLFFFLVFATVSVVNAQPSNVTTGENSPILFAKSVAANYGVLPEVVLAVVHVFDSTTLTPSQRKLKVEDLIKKYSMLPKSIDTLTNQQKKLLEVEQHSNLVSALNFDLFFKTTGKNSPIIYAPNGEAQIWYGISANAVRAFYADLETKLESGQMNNETANDAFKNSIQTYNELNKEANELGLNSEYKDQVAKVKQLIESGKLDEAEQEFATFDDQSSEAMAAVKNFHGLLLELHYKYKEATPLFKMATLLAPDSLKYMLYYSSNLLNTSNLELAISEYQKIISVVANHNDTILGSSYNNLGAAWHNRGNLDTAIHYYEKGLATGLKLFGKENAKVAVSYNNLGRVWQDKGNLDSAINHYEKALAIDLKLFGEEHPSTAMNYNNLGGALESKGNLNAAINYYEKALAIDLKLFGKDDPTVAIRYSNLGMAWSDKGNLDIAIGYLQNALAIHYKIFGNNNVTTAKDYTNLGTIWADMGDLDSAINYYEKSLAINLKLFGEESPNTANAYLNFGSVWQEKGHLDTAIGFFRKALRIDLNSLEEENPDVAHCYRNLGSVWNDKGISDTAINYSEKALVIDIKLFGEGNPNTAMDYNYLGSAWHGRPQLDSAINYYEKSLAINLKLFGENNLNTAMNYENLGLVWGDKGDFSKAKSFLLKSFLILNNTYGPNNPLTEEVGHDLEFFLEGEKK